MIIPIRILTLTIVAAALSCAAITLVLLSAR
jgi:hypothetical protein